jgi:hypothetical protein
LENDAKPDGGTEHERKVTSEDTKEDEEDKSLILGKDSKDGEHGDVEKPDEATSDSDTSDSSPDDNMKKSSRRCRFH